MSTAWTTQSARRSSWSMASTWAPTAELPKRFSVSTFQISPRLIESRASLSALVSLVLPVTMALSKPSEK